MPPTISVCIPCYNSERFIRTTIESALAQTVPPQELLISDDNSPDRSYEIVKEYECVPGVRIIRPPHRLTLGAHYRFLLERATSDYICFLSSDDALMPNFVETMRGKLQGTTNVGMVAGACLECDEKLKPRRLRGAGLPRQTFEPPHGFHFFQRGNAYTISFTLVSRKILLDTPPLPPDADLATDWGWALLLGARSKITFVQTPLGYYRIHGSNAGHSNADAWQNACVALLLFLGKHLEPELAAKLAPRIEVISAHIESLRRGEPEPRKRSPLSAKTKNLIKDLIAIRYQALPSVIVKAEQGIGLALERARTQQPA